MTSAVDDLVALCRLFAQWERTQVCCGSVTVPQCVVLQALLSGPSEVAPLARRAGSSPSAMTRLLDGLVARDLVARHRDEVDRRRVRVELTVTGRAEGERLRSCTVNALDTVIARVPAGKRAQVLESLALVREAMEAVEVDLVAS